MLHSARNDCFEKIVIGEHKDVAEHSAFLRMLEQQSMSTLRKRLILILDTQYASVKQLLATPEFLHFFESAAHFGVHVWIVSPQPMTVGKDSHFDAIFEQKDKITVHYKHDVWNLTLLNQSNGLTQKQNLIPTDQQACSFRPYKPNGDALTF